MGTEANLPLAQWRRSSACGMGDNDCVEVRVNAGRVQLRDSKSVNGPVLAFTVYAWRNFLEAVKNGELAGP